MCLGVRHSTTKQFQQREYVSLHPRLVTHLCPLRLAAALSAPLKSGKSGHSITIYTSGHRPALARPGPTIEHPCRILLQGRESIGQPDRGPLRHVLLGDLGGHLQRRGWLRRHLEPTDRADRRSQDRAIGPAELDRRPGTSRGPGSNFGTPGSKTMPRPGMVNVPLTTNSRGPPLPAISPFISPMIFGSPLQVPASSRVRPSASTISDTLRIR